MMRSYHVRQQVFKYLDDKEMLTKVSMLSKIDRKKVGYIAGNRDITINLNKVVNGGCHLFISEYQKKVISHFNFKFGKNKDTD